MQPWGHIIYVCSKRERLVKTSLSRFDSYLYCTVDLQAIHHSHRSRLRQGAHFLPLPNSGVSRTLRPVGLAYRIHRHCAPWKVPVWKSNSRPLARMLRLQSLKSLPTSRHVLFTTRRRYRPIPGTWRSIVSIPKKCARSHRWRRSLG